MAVEIERKFLLADDRWREQVTRSSHFRQGYLGGDRCSVRVRIAGDEAWLNIKSLSTGLSRDEYEYAIPADDALSMLDTLCAGPVVSKLRHWVQHAGHVWEVDEFDGDNAGLVLAEIELSAEDERFQRPPWLGAEVSDQLRYFNAALSRRPFTQWTDAERRGESC